MRVIIYTYISSRLTGRYVPFSQLALTNFVQLHPSSRRHTTYTILHSLLRLSRVNPKGALGEGGHGGITPLPQSHLAHYIRSNFTHPHENTTLRTFFHSLLQLSRVNPNGAFGVGRAQRNYSTSTHTHPHGGTTLRTFFHSLLQLSRANPNTALGVGGMEEVLHFSSLNIRKEHSSFPDQYLYKYFLFHLFFLIWAQGFCPQGVCLEFWGPQCVFWNFGAHCTPQNFEVLTKKPKQIITKLKKINICVTIRAQTFGFTPFHLFNNHTTALHISSK